MDSLEEWMAVRLRGLWFVRNVELGEVLNTFTVITTAANALVTRIHNRIPVIKAIAIVRWFWLLWCDHFSLDIWPRMRY
jgi:putative SOS response-associated peptidase YedK